jgi:hypothetical protein
MAGMGIAQAPPRKRITPLAPGIAGANERGCSLEIRLTQGAEAACSGAASEEKAAEKSKTLEWTLSAAEDLPVQGSVVMRFTLFPPQDNVIVANGRRGLPLSSTLPAAVASASASGLIRAAFRLAPAANRPIRSAFRCGR